MNLMRATVAALLACGVGASPACADGVPSDPAGHGEPWYSLGAWSGSSKPDEALSNYQWNTLPRAAWGVQARAGRGPAALGVRFGRTQTTQTMQLPAGDQVSRVGMTSLELVGEGRFAHVAGLDLAATASAGWLRLGYSPDHLSIDPGTGSPIEVRFDPVNEWIAGGGIALQRPLAGPWFAGLNVDHRIFRMDTAHRNGSEIEYRRETFGDWSARLELSWAHGRR